MEIPPKPVLLRRNPIPENYKRAEFRCHCGKVFISNYYCVQNGISKSCGCYKKNRNLRHGKASDTNKSRTYIAWCALKQRCLNPKNPAYKNYGARGIRLCERWMDFKNFFDDMGDPRKGESIDRIDNDGNYEPSNCRWATRFEQDRNKRTSRLYDFRGEKLCLVDISAKTGISIKTLFNRLVHKEWDIEKAVSVPVKKTRPFTKKPT